MGIRAFLLADIPTLVALAKRAMPHPWSEKIFRDCFKENYYGWVLQEDHVIAGFVVILLRLHDCDLMNIAVHPDYQRRGYGQLLLQHAIDFAKAKGAEKIWLEVRRSNKAAINLYQHFGAVEVGVRKDYYPDDDGREDAVLFELS
ncbi:ribosomal protein S18-alanine N-acetyltransferase [Candidiatus Paracoxiella cheracis]|uniref:ribosomal protein S18-alanine N-acetyltransferase n=1 Tax=Candidiatus Paracoxiella cheracis TaxID=3405120 RepID=UPI003BF4B760